MNHGFNDKLFGIFYNAYGNRNPDREEMGGAGCFREGISMYGDEDQNDLMQMIHDYKGGEEDMTEISIQKIEKDIEAYKEAIRNAEGALAEAERELAEELERRALKSDEDSMGG